MTYLLQRLELCTKPAERRKEAVDTLNEVMILNVKVSKEINKIFECLPFTFMHGGNNEQEKEEDGDRSEKGDNGLNMVMGVFDSCQRRQIKSIN